MLFSGCKYFVNWGNGNVLLLWIEIGMLDFNGSVNNIGCFWDKVFWYILGILNSVVVIKFFMLLVVE